MNTRRFLSIAVLSGLWTVAAAAEEPSKAELVLALYAPTAPLPSADARFGFVDKVGRYLQSAGINVHPKVFARAADLEAAIKRGQVDLAILDAFYAAERGVNYPVLAVATASGELYQRWGLYTHLQTGNLFDLSNKRLAWVSPSGNKEATYIDNVLLNGELQVAEFFQPSASAPDIGAAVSDVVLHRADCVFAPEQAVQGKSLRRIYESADAARIPNPALVQVQSRLPAATVAEIKRAIVGFNTTGVLDGWRTGGSIGEAYRQLRQRLRDRPERNLILSEPQHVRSEVTSTMVTGPEMPPVLPPLRTLLLPPADLP